jgi:hypothetical protein
MGKVILGAILGLALGAMLGAGIKNLCEEDAHGNIRKYSRIPVYKNNDAAAGTVEGIDIAPVFPMAGAVLGCIVGAIAGATAAVVCAIRRQPKGPAP